MAQAGVASARSLLGALTLLDARGKAFALAMAAFLLGERVLLASTALSIDAGGTRGALVTLAALSACAGLRTLCRLPLLDQVRQTLYRRVAEALVARERAHDPPPRTLVERVVGDGVEWLEWLVTLQAPVLLGDAAASLVVLGLAVTFLPTQVLVVGGIGVSLATAAALVVRRLSIAAGARSWDAQMAVGEALREGVEGSLELTAWGREGAYLARVDDRTAAYRRASMRADVLGQLTGRLPVFIGAAVAALLVVHDQTSRGERFEVALARALLLGSVLPPLASVAQQALDLSRNQPRLLSLLGLLEAHRLPADMTTRPITRVTLEAVSFRYSGSSSTTLTALSCEVKPGAPLVVVGKNGSGKTTLLRLLAGLSAPGGGAVWVDDEPAPARAERLLGASCLLSQRPFFPTAGATVREAMALLCEASDDEMRGALGRMGVLEALSKGGASALEARVEGLSAGQRQRVAIARCLLRKSGPLLLDEPETSLDSEGVEVLRRVLECEATTRAVVVVSHAPASVAPTFARLSLD